MRRWKNCCSAPKPITARRCKLTDDARASLRAMADGDGRYLLNLVEELSSVKTVKPLDSGRPGRRRCSGACRSTTRAARSITTSSPPCINPSAARDPDAALYWLARMLAGGEQPLYIARRLVRAAVEDIGLADPEAVHQALAAKDVFDFLGIAGRRDRAGAMRALSGQRAQIQCGLCGAGRGQAGGAGAWLADAAGAYPQCARPS